MKSVDIPDLGTVDFPDEMSDEQISKVIDKQIMPQVRADAAERKKHEKFWRGEDPEEDSPNYFSNIARGIGERTLEVGGGLLRTVGTVAEEGGDWLQRNLPETIFTLPEEEIQKPNTPLVGWADALANTKLGYEPRTTWEDVKENWTNALPFAAEQGLRSLPDMVATMYALPTYVAGRTGEIGQTRAENDGRDQASVMDLIKSAPAAVASALLERYATHGLLGSLEGQAVRSMSQLPRAMGGAAVREGATEFVQEGTDYLGETLGTNKGSTVGEGLERALAGAIAGAPFGGGVRGLTGSVQVWAANRGVEPTQENLEAAAAQGDTQAIDILRAAGLMSDEQLANLSPEAATRFAERYQGRRAAEEDPILAAQRTQEAIDRRDLEGGDTLPNQRPDRIVDQGGNRREDILKVYDTAMTKVDAAIEAGTVKPEERDAAIRQVAIGLMPELDTRERADARTVAAAQARIDQILAVPGEQHTPELAQEYLELSEVVERSKPDRVIQLGRTRAYDKQTSGSTEDSGLARAVDTHGRQRLLPAPGATVGMSGDQVEQARRAMEQPPITAGAENLYVDPVTGQASRFGEVVPEQTGLALPSPASASRLPLTREQILQAQIQSLHDTTEAMRAAGQAPDTVYGSEDRLPQTRDQVVDQIQSGQAFDLVAGRMRPRAGPDVRDTRAGGRPEGGIESQETVWLDEGRPVKIVDSRTEPRSDGTTRTIYKVHRYDPRTGQAQTDENGEVFEYEVDKAKLTSGEYAQDPRQAQEFEGDPKFDDTGARSPVVEKYKSAKTGQMVTPDAAGQRADELQKLPRQTYRETPADPNIPGAEGPTSEVPGRGPVPRSPRPEQGEGPRVDMGSNKRRGEFRGDETGAEAVARRAEAMRRAKMREQSQRNETKDEKTGEKTEWGKVRDEYESQTDGFSSTAKGVDEDGWPLTDKNGFVLSDAVGPIRFEHKKDDPKTGAVGVLTVLKAMRKQHPDAHLNPVAHPGLLRQTGPKSAEAYWTIQATQPKPQAKTGQEQAQAEQEQAAPEQEQAQAEQEQAASSVPAEIVSQPTAPEASRNDTVSTPEQGRADTETTPARNPEQLVASVEKGLRDRQVKPTPKAVAKHYEVSEKEAANALATIAGRGNKVIRQVKPSKKELAAALKPKEGAEAPAPKGPRYRLTPQFDEDMSLLEFLMSKGGLKRDGDLVAMDAHRKSHPRYGNLVRKEGGGGLTLDEARELAEGEGYIGTGDDYQSSDIQDLLDAVEDELRGNRVTTERAGSGSERDQMEARARELGIEVNSDWNDAELMIEIGEAEAIANEDNPTVQAADNLREVVDAMLVELGIFPDSYQADFDIPFGDEGAGSDQGAREERQTAEVDAASAPARAGGEESAIRPNDRAPEARTGDAQEADRAGGQTPAIGKTDRNGQLALGDLLLDDTPPRKADQDSPVDPDSDDQIDLEEAIAADRQRRADRIQPIDPASIPDPVNEKPIPTDAAPRERLLVISCGIAKSDAPGDVPALQRYTGPRFHELRKWMEANPGQEPQIVILSGKFGFISGQATIPNYDQPMTSNHAEKLVRDGAAENGAMDAAHRYRDGYLDVFIVGGGEYTGPINAAVTQLVQAGVIHPDAAINRSKGNQGVQKKQMMDWVGKVEAAPEEQAEAAPEPEPVPSLQDRVLTIADAYEALGHSPMAALARHQARTSRLSERYVADFEKTLKEAQAEAAPTFTERKVRDGSGKEPGRRGAERAEPFTAPKQTTAPDWMQTNADAVAGHPVWWDEGRQIGLVAGHSILSGQPVYAAVKGTSRTRVDVESYTGTVFTAEEKADLIAAKKADQAADAEALAKNPDGPFAGGERVAASPGVPSSLVETAREWLKMLGINARVYLTTTGEARTLPDMHGPFAAIRSAGVDANEFGSTRKLANGDHYIALKLGGRESRNLETLAHEIGHILEKEAFANASAEEKAAIRQAYESWVRSVKGGTATELVQSLRAHTTGKQTKTSDGPALNMPSYWTSFSEWFADQTSRWAMSSQVPQGVVAKFFKRVADGLRKLYAAVDGKKYLPNAEMAKWLDGRATASVQPLQGSAPAPKPGADMFGQTKDPDPGLRSVLTSALSDLAGMDPADMKADVQVQRNFVRRVREAIKYYKQGVEKNGAAQYVNEAWQLQRDIAMAGQKEGIPAPLMRELLDTIQQTGKTPAPKAEAAPKPVGVANGVARARAAIKAGSASDLEQQIYSLDSELNRRKADKAKLAEAARTAKTAYENGPAERKGSDASPRYKDNDRFERRSEQQRTASDRDANLEAIRKGEARLKELAAKLPPNPPKRKQRAQLLSRLFGRDPKTELTAEMEAADDAAWQERLEQIAPRAETVADVERILDENVERGILDKGTAKGIKSILARMPTNGLKGIRLMIQDRMTAEEREILGTDKGASGEVITFDPDTRVLVVTGENGSADAVETFVHENAHTLFQMISQQDRALARQIYDSLPISRQAMHTLSYDKDTRFEEWFAESAVDHYVNGLTTDGQRAGIPHMLGGLLQRLFKRIVDTFSNERAQVDAFFAGLGQSLAGNGRASINEIVRRERRGVSTLAILSNPIGAITGDWKAWKSGFQELARDTTQAWQNRGQRPNKQTAIGSLARAFFYSADGEYRAAIGKFNSPTLNLLADTFHAKAGGAQGLDRKIATKLDMKLSSNATFDEAVTRRVSAELNQLSRILKPFENDPVAMDRIVDLVQRPSARRSDPESVAASEIARMLAGLHRYMKDAGVDVGEIKNGYFPREINVAAVAKNPTGFVAAATTEYRRSGLGAKEAAEAADNWLTNILYGGSGSPARKAGGGSPSFVQSRVLSKQADETLKEFYQREPKMVLGSYVSRAVKRAEISRRFGDNWKNWENIEKQIREEDPSAAGMLPQLRSYAAIATGSQHYNVPSIIQSGSSLIRTIASLALLEKSTLTSLAEMITPAIRTGSALDFLPAIGTTLNELRRHLKGMPPSAAAELAADIGAIAGSGVNSIMAARFAGGDPLGRGQAKVLDTYFRRIGLTQFTDATRISATERGAVFIRRLARDIAGRGLDPSKSRIYMAEMGIGQGQIDEFVKFVNGFGSDLPSPADLNKGGEMGTAYRAALLRFDDQTIMRPGATTRPRWASHPLGAIAFQLQAFTYAFSKNVLLRSARLAKTAWDNKEGLDAYDRLLMLGPLAMLPVLAMCQYIVGELRDWLFMDPERRQAQTGAARIEKAISRAGLTGALDPYLQMVTGARYQKDPISTFTGPFLGVFGQGVGALNQWLVNDSPNTNAAERKVSEALYDLFIEPGVNMALGFAPVSPMTGLITAGFLPMMRDNFVDSVAGPRLGHKQQAVYGLSELVMGKQFEGKSGKGSWGSGSSSGSWGSGGSSKSSWGR